MRRPTTIKTVTMLIYLQILFIAFFVGQHLVIYFVPADSTGSLGTFKKNILETNKIVEYTSDMLISNLLFLMIPVIVLLLIMFYIRKRKLVPSILLTLILLLVAIVPLQRFIILAMVIFLFTPSARKYFKGALFDEPVKASKRANDAIEVDGEVVNTTESVEQESQREQPITLEKPKSRPLSELEVTIREATADDADTIHALMLMAFEEYRASVPPSSALEETSDSIREALTSGAESAAIVYEDDLAVAMVRYQMTGDAIYFFRLSVVPNKRRRGYAKRLIKWLEHLGTSKGKDISRCKVRQNVQNNLVLYQDLGYEVVDQELVVRPTGTVKTLTMEKSLRPR
ncbi:MAG: GNAT family N-acetyltransferase [Candidatus Cohnella colombiensis]|uniref:GNAT family N-acetyltransferase n=1 Tax=Candidatus Cohnella colombiensis TaxID=3121368 RepID=A0AA95JDL4_9BACL|nr:MAG: GNAT family N-acetyltransferase [Cohnella sp.]